MRAAKLSVILLLIGLLTACGFKLRGSAELPGTEQVARAAKLQEMAADLTACARLWRADALR